MVAHALKEKGEIVKLHRLEYNEKGFVDVAFCNATSSEKLFENVGYWIFEKINERAALRFDPVFKQEPTSVKQVAISVGTCRSGSPTVYIVKDNRAVLEGADISVVAVANKSKPQLKEYGAIVASPDKKLLVSRDRLILGIGTHEVPIIRLYGKKRKMELVDTLEFKDGE